MAWTLEPLTNRYAMAVETRTQELTAEARMDSSSRSTDVLVVISAIDANRLIAEFTAPRNVADAAVPARRSRSATDSVAIVRLHVDPASTRSELESASRDSCTTEASLLSPLVAHLLVQSPRSTTNTPQPPLNSIEYTTCSAGSRLRVSFQLRPNAGEGDRRVRLAIDGRVRADSTRSLPMHLDGTITGHAILARSSAGSVLPDSVEVTLDYRLTARSAIKEQRFEQHVVTRMVRR